MENSEKVDPQTKKEIYENEEKNLIRFCNLSPHEYQKNKEHTESYEGLDTAPKELLWFMPFVKNPLAGGIRTAFLIADYFSRAYGSKSYFVIEDFKGKGKKLDIDSVETKIKEIFPALQFEIIVFNPTTDKIENLPKADIGLCTLWLTAYLLAKYNQCKKKMYLVQDYEPLFYPAGTLSALIEETYRLGFHAICNTKGVFNQYLSHGGRGFFFTPSIRTELFSSKPKSSRTTQIVFYGRTNERNAFILGAETLVKLKRRLQDKVNIISVGEDWTDKYPEFQDRGIECRGRLGSMKEVAELYAESHLGLCFMMTPHPSYQPFEYMASKCVPVVGINKANDWLLRDNETCLQVPAIMEVAADKIYHLIKDKERMEQIAESGYKLVHDLDPWDVVLGRISEYMMS